MSVCQGEGRLNHPVIGDKLGGLEVKGNQAAPLRERTPKGGLPQEGTLMEDALTLG